MSKKYILEQIDKCWNDEADHSYWITMNGGIDLRCCYLMASAYEECPDCNTHFTSLDNKIHYICRKEK